MRFLLAAVTVAACAPSKEQVERRAVDSLEAVVHAAYQTTVAIPALVAEAVHRDSVMGCSLYLTNADGQTWCARPVKRR